MTVGAAASCGGTTGPPKDGLGYSFSLGLPVVSAGLPVLIPWPLLFRARSSSVTECVRDLQPPPPTSERYGRSNAGVVRRPGLRLAHARSPPSGA